MQTDLKEEENLEKGRTDTMRLKLVRKAISIPHLILKNTQRPNTIKDLKQDDAITVYRRCFQEFINMCCVYGILLDKDDPEIFKVFICLKYPDSKVLPLLGSEDTKLYREVKKYLQILSVKALFEIQNRALWEVLKALLKLEHYFIGEQLQPKSQEILDSLISRLSIKLKGIHKYVEEVATYKRAKYSEFTSEDSNDRE